MYARVVTMSGADAGKREAALEMINGTVIPTLRGYDGFKGYIALWDAEKSDAKAILLWENEATAETAEETLKERRLQFAGGVGLTVESADLYETLVFELV
jgi:hypothetical protein